MAEKEEEVLRVKGSSPAAALASAISYGVYDGQTVTLRAIGAAAVNQAVKAIAIAQGYVAPRGLVLYTRPGFTDVNMKDGVVTAIVFRVFANKA